MDLQNRNFSIKGNVRLAVNFLAIFVVLGILGSVATSGVTKVNAGPALAPEAVAVHLHQTEYYVYRGGTVPVKVVIDQPNNVGGFEFDLGYQTKFVTYTTSSDAGYVGATGRGLVPLAWFPQDKFNTIVGPNGTASFVSATCPFANCSGPSNQTRIDNGPGNGTGIGTLATITFTGSITVGRTSLALNNAMIVHPDASILYQGNGVPPTATLAVGTFTDLTPFVSISPGFAFAWPFAEDLYDKRITVGCATNPLKYCPANFVIRQDLATFMVRAAEWAIVPGPYTRYSDVPAPGGAFAPPFIETAFQHGLDLPCDANPPQKFCPLATVPRREMAQWIVLTQKFANPGDPSWDPNQHTYQGHFADVGPADPDRHFIEILFEKGIVGGCTVSPRNYCPASLVARSDMAKFLVNAFGVPHIVE